MGDSVTDVILVMDFGFDGAWRTTVLSNQDGSTRLCPCPKWKPLVMQRWFRPENYGKDYTCYSIDVTENIINID